MEEDKEAVKSEEKSVYNDPKTGQFVKDNPGKPVGTKHYSTLMDEAMEEVAKLNGMTLAQYKIRIYQKGLGEALKGDYSFYRDYLDRTHGKPETPIDITTKGESIFRPSEKEQEKIDKALGNII